MPRIAFFVEIIKGKVTGPTNSVTTLSRELRLLGIDTKVYSIFPDCGVDEVCGEPIFSIDDFYKDSIKFDLCVFEGAYKTNMWRLALHCKLKKIKYIISPRSNLMKLSFKKSPIQKILSLIVVVPYFRNSRGIHFLSKDEYINSYSFGVRHYLASNGIDSDNTNKPENEFKQKYNKNNVVFIGRYDIYHKGLDILINFVSKNKTILRNNKFTFELYGPNFRGGKENIQRDISRNGIRDLITVNDAVFGVAKLKILYKSKYFIHTSRYEGQPQAVLEAINAGCIPIVSSGCNLSEVLSLLGYGVEFSPDMSGDEFLISCDESLPSNSKLEEFRSRYSWKSSTRQFYRVINEVLKNG